VFSGQDATVRANPFKNFLALGAMSSTQWRGVDNPFRPVSITPARCMDSLIMAEFGYFFTIFTKRPNSVGCRRSDLAVSDDTAMLRSTRAALLARLHRPSRRPCVAGSSMPVSGRGSGLCQRAPRILRAEMEKAFPGSQYSVISWTDATLLKY